jgi:hypothetical protein
MLADWICRDTCEFLKISSFFFFLFVFFYLNLWSFVNNKKSGPSRGFPAVGGWSLDFKYLVPNYSHFKQFTTPWLSTRLTTPSTNLELGTDWFLKNFLFLSPGAYICIYISDQLINVKYHNCLVVNYVYRGLVIFRNLVNLFKTHESVFFFFFFFWSIWWCCHHW